MFENIAISLLNRIFGKYFENFNGEQLELAIWNGVITLNNIELRHDVLQKLGFGFGLDFDFFEINNGIIGDITILIPWSNLKNLPIQIFLKNVRIQLNPTSLDVLNSFKLEKYQKIKMEKINNWENNNNINPFNDKNDKKNPENYNSNIVRSLETKLLNNIQVSIENFLLVFSDNNSFLTINPTQIVLLIDLIKFHSTDKKWNLIDFINKSNDIFKKLTIKSLRIIKKDFDINNNSIIVNSNLDDDYLLRHGFSYILEPLDTFGNCELHKINSLLHNKTKIDFNLPNLNISIDDNLYANLKTIFKSFDRNNELIEMRLLRPNGSIHTNPKEWFKFYLFCVNRKLHLKYKHKNWNHIRKICNKRRIYIPLWISKLKQENILIPLPNEDDELKLEKLHKELEYEQIITFRQIARKLLDNEQKKLSERNEILNQETNTSRHSWFSNWWYHNSNDDAKKDNNFHINSENDSQFVIPSEAQTELRQLLDDDEIDYDTDSEGNQPVNNINCTINFLINSFQFELKRNDINVTLTKIKTLDALLQYKVENGENTVNFETNTFDVENGALDNQFSKFFTLDKFIENTNIVQENSEPKLSFQVKINGDKDIYENATQIQCKIFSFILTYHMAFIVEIPKFFIRPISPIIALDKLITDKPTRFSCYTDRGKGRIWREFLQELSTIFTLEVLHPAILLPVDPLDDNCNCICINSYDMFVFDDPIPTFEIEELKSLSLSQFREIDTPVFARLLVRRLIVQATEASLIVAPDIKSIKQSFLEGNEDKYAIVPKRFLKIGFDISKSSRALHIPMLEITFNLQEASLIFSEYQFTIFTEFFMRNVPNFADYYPIDDFNEYIHPYYNKTKRCHFKRYEDYKKKKTVGKFTPVKLFNFNFENVTLLITKVLDEDAWKVMKLFEFRGNNFKMSYSLTLSLMQIFLNVNTLNIYSFINDQGVSQEFVVTKRPYRQEEAICFSLRYERHQRIILNKGNFYEIFDHDYYLDAANVDINFRPVDVLSFQIWILLAFTNPYAIFNPTDIFKHNDENAFDSPRKIHFIVNFTNVNLLLSEGEMPFTRLYLPGLRYELTDWPEHKIHTLKFLGLYLYEISNNSLVEDSSPIMSISNGHKLTEIIYEALDMKKVHNYFGAYLFLDVALISLEFRPKLLFRLQNFCKRFGNIAANFKFAYNNTFKRNEYKLVRNCRYEIWIEKLNIILPDVSSAEGQLNNYCNVDLLNVFCSVQLDNTGNQYCRYAGVMSMTATSVINSKELKRQEKDIFRDISVFSKKKYKLNHMESTCTKSEYSVSPIKMRLCEIQASVLVQVYHNITKIFSHNPPLECLPHYIRDANGLIMYDVKDLTTSLKKMSDSSFIQEYLEAIDISLIEVGLFHSDSTSFSHLTPLFKCTANNIHASYFWNTISFSKFDIKLEELRLINYKTNEKDLEYIIKSNSCKLPQLEIDVQKKLNLNYSQWYFGVTVCNTDYCISLDFIKEVVLFYQRCSYDSTSPDYIDLEPQSRIEPTKIIRKYQSQPQLSFDIKISRSRISLVLNPSTNNCNNMLFLNIRMFKLTHKGIVEISFEKLSSYFVRDNTHKFYIFKDISTLSKKPKLAPSRRTNLIELQLPLLPVQISLNQIGLARNFYQDLMETLNTFELKPLNKTNKDNTKSDRVSPPLEESPFEEIQLFKVQDTPSKPKTDRADAKIKKDIVFHSSGLEFTLIGDVGSLPILLSKINPFTVTYRFGDTYFDVDAKIELTMKTFDNSRGTWDILTDNTPCTIHFAKNLRDSSPFTFNLTSEKVAELTLSSKSLSLLSNIQKKLSQPPVISLEPEILPYIIKNATEFKLDVWDYQNNTKNGHKKVASGRELPWDFDDTINIQETKLEERFLGVAISSHGYGTSLRVDLKLEGEFLFDISYTPDGIKHKIACELKVIENDVKVITFKSTLELKNYSEIGLYLKLLEDKKEENKEIYLDPFATFFVPLKCITNLRIMVRPEFKKKYGWYDEIITWQRLMKGPIELKSKSLHNAKYQFLEVVAKSDPSETLNRVYPHMKIFFTVPIIIRNLLPHDLSFSISNGKGFIVENVLLKHKEKMPLYKVNLKESLYLHIISFSNSSKKYSGKCEINTTCNKDPVCVTDINLMDSDKKQIALKLHIERSFNSQCRMIRIFSPYLLLNETGRDLYIKSNTGDVFYSKAEEALNGKYAVPQLYSYSGKKGKRSVVNVRLEDSHWSEKVSFDVINQTFDIALESKKDHFFSKLAISISEGEELYFLSRVVRIRAQFTIVNDLPNALTLANPDCSFITNVEPNSSKRLLDIPEQFEEFLIMKIAGTATEWSSPLSLINIGELYVKLFCPNDDRTYLLKIEIIVEFACTFICVSHSKEHWPFEIRNFTDEEFSIYQKDPLTNYKNKLSNYSKMKKYFAKGKNYHIPAHSSISYAWDFPTVDHKRLIVNWKGNERKINLMNIGSSKYLKCSSKNLGDSIQTISLEVFGEGFVNVLNIKEPDRSLKKIRSSTSSTFSRIKEASTDTSNEESSLTMEFKLSLEGIGINLLDFNNNKFCYLHSRDLELVFQQTKEFNTLKWKVSWAQIDNLLTGAKYKNMFYPLLNNPSKWRAPDEDIQEKATFHQGIIQKVRNENTSKIDYFKYVYISFNSFALKIEEDFVIELINLFIGPNIQEGKPSRRKYKETKIPVREFNNALLKNAKFFELIDIEPLDIHLSFKASDKIHFSREERKLNSLKDSKTLMLVNFLSMAIGNVNDAKISMKRIRLRNLQIPVATLVHNIQQYYKQQFFYQFHKVLGSSSVIGNPVNIFKVFNGGSLFDAPPPLPEINSANVGPDPHVLKHSAGMVGKGFARITRNVITNDSNSGTVMAAGDVSEVSTLNLNSLDRDCNTKTIYEKEGEGKKEQNYILKRGNSMTSLRRSMGSSLKLTPHHDTHKKPKSSIKDKKKNHS